MKSNYENCQAITLKWEGGDVNHPDDPGGKTRWGITQATYDAWRVSQHLAKKSVFTMTKAEMLAIYKAKYWDAVGGDTLALGVDLATWDFGVNSGPARAKKTLLSVVGGTDIQTIQKLCAKRMSFLKGLTIFKTFGKGWSNRVADIEARAVKMTLAGTTTVRSSLMVEALKADTSAKQKTNVTKAAGSASTASVIGTNGVDQYLAWGLLGLAAVGVGVAVYFALKAKHNKERAEAYTRVAEEV
jgi:lysozyme family protein